MMAAIVILAVVFALCSIWLLARCAVALERMAATFEPIAARRWIGSQELAEREPE